MKGLMSGPFRFSGGSMGRPYSSSLGVFAMIFSAAAGEKRNRGFRSQSVLLRNLNFATMRLTHTSGGIRMPRYRHTESAVTHSAPSKSRRMAVSSFPSIPFSMAKTGQKSKRPRKSKIAAGALFGGNLINDTRSENTLNLKRIKGD